jgi:uncharacterized membrane protein YgaE (UPF0421/DUF939 family)
MISQILSRIFGGLCVIAIALAMLGADSPSLIPSLILLMVGILFGIFAHLFFIIHELELDYKEMKYLKDRYKKLYSDLKYGTEGGAK